MSGKELMIGEKPLSSLRVVDLKEELEKRGLSKSGSKRDLVDRLRANVLEEAASQQGAADEEELPNIAMQEKLAEKNPFLRDYFASQAELFHSQKLAKQLIEDERRRESEASAPSADEGGEESSAAEDKARDSSTESAVGKVKKLAKRFENQATEKENSEPPTKIPATSPEKAKSQGILEKPSPPVEKSTEEVREPTKEIIVESTTPVQEPKVKSAQPVEQVQAKKSLPVEDREEKAPILLEEPITKHSISKQDITKMSVDDKKPSDDVDDEETKSNSSGSSRSRSISPAPKLEPGLTIGKTNSSDAVKKLESEKEASSSSEDEGEDEPGNENDGINNGIGNVRKLTEQFESQGKDSEEKMEIVIKSDEPVQLTSIEVNKSVSEERPESDSSRSSSKSRSRSRSVSPVVTSRQVDSQLEKQSSPDGPEQSMTPLKESESKVQKLKEQFEKSDTNEKGSLEAQKEPSPAVTKIVIEKIPIEAPKRKLILAPAPTESKSLAEIRNKRKVSVRNEEIEDEDALDYGEEEKVKSEPAKFDWARRVLRLKNKHAVKDQGKKWLREVENKLTENINTEYLNQWFPEIKLVSASDLRLDEKEKSPSAEEPLKITRTISLESNNEGIAKMENITITRKVSLIPMIPSQMEDDTDKDLSPARHPPSSLILITNLVRPFTLPQLRELLQRTGNLKELWVDKIKSKCIAMYEQEEEAFETRAALHGVNWPQSNPKALHVDYTSEERMNDYKSRESGEPKPLIVERPVTAEALPVREWDVGKRAKSRSPNRTKRRSRSVSRDRKRLRKSPSPNRRRGSRSPHRDRRSRGDVKEPEPLGKALDELFRKTIATPSIYWLPLTPQQIAEKEELRRKRMVERERRLAEMNKIRPR